MNRYFDIALNLASERFSGERDKVIANALTNNVNYFNIVCSSIDELDFVKDLYKQDKISMMTKTRIVNQITNLQVLPKKTRKWVIKNQLI